MQDPAHVPPRNEIPTMSDSPKAFENGPLKTDEPVDSLASLDVDARATPFPEGGEYSVLSLVEETLKVSKRRRLTARVRIGTRTEAFETSAQVELDRYRVEVTRVPVGRVVTEVPEARAEGDTTVFPVVEERLVVVKQLVLVEEVRVRHVLERETVSEPATLRRQRAVVERFEPNDSTDRDEVVSEDETARGAEEERHGSVGQRPGTAGQ